MPDLLCSFYREFVFFEKKRNGCLQIAELEHDRHVLVLVMFFPFFGVDELLIGEIELLLPVLIKVILFDGLPVLKLLLKDHLRHTDGLFGFRAQIITFLEFACSQQTLYLQSEEINKKSKIRICDKKSRLERLTLFYG